jgi:hypothetical protein
VQTGGAYSAALAEREEQRRAALDAAGETAEPTETELQTRSDAALAAKRTFPAADLGGDGKGAATAEPTDEAAAETEREHAEILARAREEVAERRDAEQPAGNQRS